MWQQVQAIKEFFIVEWKKTWYEYFRPLRKWWFWAFMMPVMMVGSFTGAYISTWHKELEEEMVPWILWPTIIISGIIMLVMEIRDRLNGNQV